MRSSYNTKKRDRRAHREYVNQLLDEDFTLQIDHRTPFHSSGNYSVPDMPAHLRTQSSHSSEPAPVTQFSGNMLGAKARAAEYNAARAASARQQANEEADEFNEMMVSNMAPLAAYLQASASNRHRGAIASGPSANVTDSVDSTRAYESTQTMNTPSTSTSDPIGLRPASLPPLSAIPLPATAMLTRHDSYFERQLPYQHQGQPVPYAPRAMRNENYNYIHSQNLYSQPLMQHLAGRQIHLSRPITPFKNNGTQQTLFNSDPRPFHTNQHLPQAPSSQHDVNPVTPSPQKARPMSFEVQAFGPDDISPTKIEVKERARAAIYKMSLTEGRQQSAEQSQYLKEDTHSTYNQATRRTNASSASKTYHKENPTGTTFTDADQAELRENQSTEVTPSKTQPSGKNPDANISTPKHALNQIANLGSKQILLDSLLEKRTPVRPPPGLEQVVPDPQRLEAELDDTQSDDTIQALPAFKIPTQEWLAIRPPNAAERQLIRKARQEIHSRYPPPGEDDTLSSGRDSVTTMEEDFQAWQTKQKDEIYWRKTLIDEMLEAKGASGNNEARTAAQTVVAVQEVLQVLQASQDGRIIGSTKYVAPPAHAIDRYISVRPVKSVFEIDSEGRYI